MESAPSIVLKSRQFGLLGGRQVGWVEAALTTLADEETVDKVHVVVDGPQHFRDFDMFFVGVSDQYRAWTEQ